MLRFMLLLSFVVLASTLRMGIRWIKDVTHIGANYAGKPMVVTVVFDRCFVGIPREYRFEFHRNINLRDWYNATILQRQEWGFSVRVQRADRHSMAWHMGVLALEWMLVYASSGFKNNPCMNGGNCTNHVTGHKCHCTPEYSGPLCQTRLVYCYPNPCNDGQCTEFTSGYECTCPPGKTGTNCTISYVEEEAKVLFEAANSTSVTTAVLYPTCKSQAPFKIQVMSDDEGDDNDGATIYDVYSWGFRAKVWRENDFDNFPANETVILRWRAFFDTHDFVSNPCENGGSCRNVENGTTCDCPARTTGSLCETILTHCSSMPCLNGGTCSITSSSYSCECPQHFAGARCETVPSISSNATLPRFAGGGPPYGDRVAVAYDQCHSGNAASIRAAISSLNTTSDAFHHTILNIYSWGFEAVVERTDRPEVGWEDNEVNIKYTAVFETRDSLKSPCVHASNCTNNEVAGVRCNCEPDYTGEFCEKELTPCDPNPCGVGTCVGNDGSYVCACPDDHAGTNCEITIKASGYRTLRHKPFAQPYTKSVDVIYERCQIGLAQRVEHNVVGHGRNRFSSTLVGIYPWGFTLDIIRTDQPNSGWSYGSGTIHFTAFFDPLKPFKRNCLNGGRCRNGDEGRICQCTDAYGGDFCHKRLNCYPNPCNGGSCEEREDGFSCTCLEGWSGHNCSKKGPWLSGTYNLGSSNRLSGYDGREFSVLFDRCYTETAVSVTATSKPHRRYFDNYVTIVEGIHRWGFKVRVRRRDRYSYSWGESQVSMKWKVEFASQDYLRPFCVNGGNCTNRRSGQTCQCPESYNGKHCENLAVFCKTPNLCNGGVCTDRPNDYHCDCPSGRGGKNCEKGYRVRYADMPFLDSTTTTIIKTILFDSCMVEAPFQVDILIHSNISTTAGAKVLDIYSWGIRVKIWRQNDGDFPSYEPTAIEYRALFNATDFTTNPCYPGGKCRNVLNGTTCDCNYLRSGRHCEIKLDYCYSSPCLNGGRCHSGYSKYYCFCNEPYTGDRCEIEPSISARTRILPYQYSAPHYGQVVAVTYDRCYTGTAVAVRATVTGSRYYVDRFNHTILGIYPWGFRALVQRTDRPGEGWDQTDVKMHWTAVFGSRSFKDFPCVRAINCYNSVTLGRKCRCWPGHTGEFCEIPLRFCYPNPCNGGVCTEFGNDYNCSCPENQAGKDCEIALKLNGTWTVRPLRRVPPYYKTISVAYDRCQSSLAYNITATANGTEDNGETFDTKVMGTFPWGFRVRVWRTDRPESRWKQRRVEIQWIAYFADVKTLGECQNRGWCVNGLEGRHCRCMDGYSGDFCETYRYAGK